MTPEPYESAPMPEDLMAEEYKALTVKQAAAEDRYDEVVVKHKEWKAAKAKEAWAEKLRLKEEACAAKLEALRQQDLEKEHLRLEVEEKEQLQLEAEEKQWKLDLEKKELEEAAAKKALEEAMVKKALEDLAKEKAKELEDKENENLLAATRIASDEEGDSKLDPGDLKTIAMAELRKRCEIAQGKKKVGTART
ncbi:uncharacterized protein ARMOST_10099 [Armillaria ostoyae]|uniref:Uncharacterized protein n=1 Tax=Armillaria ostoyae TaxID=47428 RepID=A0A284RDB0_ARMOS|nr:uncharacterized protein ARMOST_10099 [Armillaria ostoyae]